MLCLSDNQTRGRSKIFFRRGCTRLLPNFNTNKPNSFFLQNTSCIRKPQVISGAGVRAPCTLPLDPPLQTMAFEDQSTIPKATCIEIGVYHFVMRLLSRHSKTPPSSAPVLFHFSLSMADKL